MNERPPIQVPCMHAPLTHSHTPMHTHHILLRTHVLTPMPTHEAHECTQIHVCSHIHMHALIPPHADHACTMQADPHMPSCMPPNTCTGMHVSTHLPTHILAQHMHRHTQAPSAHMCTCPHKHAQEQAGSWVSPFMWVKGEA